MKVATYAHLLRTGDPTTGVGKHIINMARGMSDNGWDVSILTSRRDLVNGQTIPEFSRLHGMKACPLPGSRVLLERGWTLLNRPYADRWTGKVDWVYSPEETYVAARNARIAGTIHCVNWFDPEVPWYNEAETVRARRRMGIRWRTLLRRTDVVLTVSQFLKRRIVELFGTDERKIEVVGNGVENAYFDAANSTPVVGDRPYLLVIGGLTQRKGAPQVLALARELAARKIDLEIKVVGKSEERYAGPAKELPSIKPLGMLGLDRLPALVRGSVAVVFLSRYETFGIPAIEAMAGGAPLIAAHYAALPEVTGDGGLIFDPAKTAEIADCCNQLLRDDSLRQSTIEKGRRRAEMFRWEHCVKRLMTVLQDRR